MADRRAGELSFSVPVIVLVSCFIAVAAGDTDVSGDFGNINKCGACRRAGGFDLVSRGRREMLQKVTQAAASIGISALSSPKQVTAISTQKDVVMHRGVSGGGRGGAFSGARGGGGSFSRGGSSSGSAGSSNGKTKGGAWRAPLWGATTVGSRGRSRNETHSGGSQSWNYYLVVSAAAAAVGITAIVA